MIAHISYCKREDGHLGGVPKFGQYCADFLGAKCIAWHAGHGAVFSDFPQAAVLDLSEEQKAILLGAHLTKTGLLDWADHIIADGFWANGFPLYAPVTVVCHGTWAESAKRGGYASKRFIEEQDKAFHRFPVVAVSEAAARQLKEHHGVEAAAIIPNGIDLERFKPRPHASHRPVVIHVSNSPGKGGLIVDKLHRYLPDYEIRYLGAKAGEEAEKFAAGDCFVFPSVHEGDSYALIEAMACGLPVVASAVGRLEGWEGRQDFGFVLPREASPTDYAEAIRAAIEDREDFARGARSYMESFSAQRWAAAWLEFLGAKGERKMAINAGVSAYSYSG